MRVTTGKHTFSAVPLPCTEETSRTPPPANVWAIGVLFLTGLAGAALTYAALVYVVNPVRDFGPTSTFPAVRSDYRNEKIALFDSFAARGPVDGLVLGSSRSMLLNGTRMSGLANGARIFNFGLASAKGEDFLAALRFALSRGQRPKRVIIGVDVESLRDTRAHGDSLHPLRELAVGPADTLAQSRILLERVATWSYAQDTFRSIYLRASHRQAAVGFFPDGTLEYRAREQQRREGKFHLDAEMAGCIAGCRKKIEDTSELSPTQIGYLKQTIREARAAGATVTLWLTGPHPRAVEHMTAGTAYAHLVASTWGLLRTQDGLAFNLHDPAAYGGPNNGWYDCNHFDESHARIIERILITGQTQTLADDPIDNEHLHHPREIAGGTR